MRRRWDDKGSRNCFETGLVLDRAAWSRANHKEIAMHRRIAICAVITCFISLPPVLGDTQEKVHEGIVLSVTADTLAMTDPDGKNEHSHKIDAGVAILIDEKPAKVTDLAKGDKIQVTIGQDGKVTRIVTTRAKK